MGRRALDERHSVWRKRSSRTDEQAAVAVALTSHRAEFMESPEDPGANPAPSPVFCDTRTWGQLHERALYRFYARMASQLSPVGVVRNFLQRILSSLTHKAPEEFAPTSIHRRCSLQ